MSDTLLLTATVAPRPGVYALSRVNVDERKDDYRRALTFYCDELAQGRLSRLVFVDNSNHGVDFLTPIVDAAGVSDRVEMISYAGLSTNVAERRLSGETKLLLTAVRQSAFLSNPSESDRFWKVTGRYVVRNYRTIMSRSKPGFDLYIHCRNYSRKFVDFGFAGFRTQAASGVLEQLLAIPGIAEGNESDFRRALDEGAFSKFRVSHRFPSIPDFSGVRGFDNKSYDGARYRALYHLRSTANFVAPWLWL